MFNAYVDSRDAHSETREPTTKRRLLAQAPNSSGTHQNIYMPLEASRATEHGGAADYLYPYPSFQDSVSTRSTSSTPKIQSLFHPSEDDAATTVRVLKDVRLEPTVVTQLFTMQV